MSDDPVHRPRKRRLLVIDDEPDFTRLLKILLEDFHHFEVTEVNRSREAIAVAQSVHPDVIVLDVVMPGMDGRVLFHELKGDPQFDRTPVILLTALLSSSDLSRTSSTPIDDRLVLSKPVELAKLIETIDAAAPPRPFRAPPSKDHHPRNDSYEAP